MVIILVSNLVCNKILKVKKKSSPHEFLTFDISLHFKKSDTKNSFLFYKKRLEFYFSSNSCWFCSWNSADVWNSSDSRFAINRSIQMRTS